MDSSRTRVRRVLAAAALILLLSACTEHRAPDSMAAIHRVETSPGSRTLKVTVFGDATPDGKLCTAVASAEADESPDRVDVKIMLRDVCPVTLPIWETNRHGFGSTALQEVEVVLQRPLGGRKVFDAQGGRIFNVVHG